MPITISDTGITGLPAGGLPDATVTTADILDANITAAKLSGAQTGSAPVYGCRAWCAFNGVTGALIASGNVSSITKTGTGTYEVNFTVAMPDTSYAVVGSANGGGIGILPVVSVNQSVAQTVNKTTLYVTTGAVGTPTDSNYVTASIFR